MKRPGCPANMKYSQAFTLLGVSRVPVREWFFLSSAYLLLITGVAKVVSAFGKVAILSFRNPILLLTHREVFLIVGSLEILIAGYLLFGSNSLLKTLTISTAGWSFLLYRFALLHPDTGSPCPCLGTLHEILPVSQDVINTLLFLIAIYMFAGAVVFFVLQVFIRPKVASVVQQDKHHV